MTINIGVCLATYNGSKYIKQQIESILPQLGANDIILVSDDSSTDDTVKIVKRINDGRIKLHINPQNLGYVDNFQNALSLIEDCNYIFFSDQDDIWIENRVQIMIDYLQRYNKNILYGTYNLIYHEHSDSIITLSNPQAKSGLINIVSLFLGLNQFPYYGSASVITSKARSYIFPIPIKEIGHDIWISILGNMHDDIVHLSQPVTIRRIHGNNLTNSNRSIYSKLLTRLYWTLGVLKFYLMKRKNGQ
jgi:glycosyltransferase involved in cell wall biosynthesis